MVHFTCDLCGQELPLPDAQRYVLKIEVYAAYDPLEITEEDLDRDHMEEISKLLREIEDIDTAELEDGVYKSFRFDLCSECHKKFLKDPLGKAAIPRFDFSEN